MLISECFLSLHAPCDYERDHILVKRSDYIVQSGVRDRHSACLTGEIKTSTALSCVISEHTEPNKLGFSPAPLAFKDPMTRGILQFALLIAFRCVLHRYGNQDIHR